MARDKKTKNRGSIQDIIDFFEELKKHHEVFSRFAYKHTDFAYFPYKYQLDNYINDLHEITED